MSERPEPHMVAPKNACDCAIHVYDPAVGHVIGTTFPAPDWATVDAYRAVQSRFGTSRVVVVQPNAYGFDNVVTLSAVAAFGLEDARAIATVPPGVADDDLERLSRGGAVGARCHFLPGGLLSWADLEPLAPRIAPFGWHVQVQLDGRQLADYEAKLRDLPCPVMIDHIGKFLEPVAVDHAGVKALLRLLENGRCWLKLAAAYEVSRRGPPDYADVAAIARAAIAVAPERLVWGSNWPHISALADPPSRPPRRARSPAPGGDRRRRRGVANPYFPKCHNEW